MISLADFDIRSGSDEQHLQNSTRRILSSAEFFKQAGDVLKVIGPRVLEEVTPELETYQGKWNPGGFMVFPIGVHEELGSLRFHVWPEGITRESSQGPNIHDHAWFLRSEILLGTYKDTLYGIEDVGSATEGLTEGTFGLYETARNAGGHDILAKTGRLVKPVPLGDREIEAGGSHDIDLGMYHITTIPDSELAVTLIFDSPPFGPTTRVLIPSTEREIGRVRRPVDRESALLAKTQIMQAMHL